MAFYKDSLPVNEVEAILLDRLMPLPEESFPLSEALDRVSSRDVLAFRDEPPFDKSAMDGFAIHESNLSGGVLSISGESRIGQATHFSLSSGQAIYVSTGSPVPLGASAVVPIEQCYVVEGSVVVCETTNGKHVIARAEKLVEGQQIVKRGNTVSLSQIALLASQGIEAIHLVRRPTVAFFATGDEVSDHPAEYEVFDAITPMIQAWCHAHRLPIVETRRLADDPDEIHGALSQSKADLIVTSGGASVGKKDFTRKAVAGHAEIIVPGVCVKPGSPAFVAIRASQTYLGLPGNPNAAAHQLDLLGNMILFSLCQGN